MGFMVCVLSLDISIYIFIYIYIHIEGWGVSPTGKSFRSVRACVRAVWLSGGHAPQN